MGVRNVLTEYESLSANITLCHYIYTSNTTVLCVMISYSVIISQEKIKCNTFFKKIVKKIKNLLQNRVQCNIILSMKSGNPHITI